MPATRPRLRAQVCQREFICAGVSPATEEAEPEQIGQRRRLVIIGALVMVGQGAQRPGWVADILADMDIAMVSRDIAELAEKAAGDKLLLGRGSASAEGGGSAEREQAGRLRARTRELGKDRPAEEQQDDENDDDELRGSEIWETG